MSSFLHSRVDRCGNQVVKAFNATHFPPIPPLPLFDVPYVRRTDPHNFILERSYLQDDYFYLAWTPLIPFPQDSPMTECFNYSEATLPIVLTVQGGYAQFALDPVVLQRWRSFEEMMSRTIAALYPLVFPAPGKLPFSIRPCNYGYSTPKPSKEEMRTAAWGAREAFTGVMAFVSFLLAVCRHKTLPQWKERLEEKTNHEWANFVRSSPAISSRDVSRRGGFLHPYAVTKKWRWLDFLRTLIKAGVPLWIPFGDISPTIGFTEFTLTVVINPTLSLDPYEFSRVNPAPRRRPWHPLTVSESEGGYWGIRTHRVQTAHQSHRRARRRTPQ